MVSMLIHDKLSAAAKVINTELAAVLSRTDGDARMWEAMRYSALAPGKRVRPFIALSVCEAVGGNPQAALPLAVAVELMHVASLVHDDLPAMDDDVLRRGQPTCHVKYDEATAILAGDALMLLGFEVIANANCLTDKQKVAAMQALSTYAGAAGMIGGQMIDLASTGGEPLTLAQLTSLQKLKTGRLLQMAATFGCIAVNADDIATKAMKQYTAALGLLFQITDDILDVTASAEVLGKTAGKDGRDGKSTFVSLLGLDGAKAEALRYYKQAIEPIAEYDKYGTLRELAEMILTRTK